MIEESGQGLLPLRLPAPRVHVRDIERVCRFLTGRGWIGGKDICAALGIGERRLRAIAEHSAGRILSGPGSPGFRLFDKSALADADAIASAHESQARAHLRRARSIRARYHRYARQHEARAGETRDGRRNDY